MDDTNYNPQSDRRERKLNGTGVFFLITTILII
jgi:hypothetical protein